MNETQELPIKITLKVAEASRKDVGRALARIDPKDMEKLNASAGDVVYIHGKRSTVVKLMPAYPEARGKSTIQVDGLTRRNAGVGLGEKVIVTLVNSLLATSVTLRPVSEKTPSRQRDLDYMGKLLNDLPVIKGDMIRATLFGSRFQDFTVMETRPSGPVLIRSETVINLLDKADTHSKARISYEDIGGLDKPILRVREMIELPLKYPQIFQRLGIDPPKGVLLHGPPGTGKTLLARAVAHETDATFLSVSGPEIIQKMYGESEAKLREIFDTAKKNAPSIIFLDEIDSIAPKREQVVGEVEKRVVAQLLALMDGLEGRGEIVVIGATNLPNMLDQALRRPGRFDREIAIGIPDAKSRYQIMEIHTRGMPLTEDVDLERLAEITHGFTGADMAALCREAAMTSVRRIFPRIDFDNITFPYELLDELIVSMEDFSAAMNEVDPSAIREVFVEVPNIGWDDIGGLEEVKQQLKESVEWPLAYRELFAYAKMRAPKGILMYGVPGCGKTLIAKALAKESELNFLSVKGPELMSKYVGESERGVREIFQKARHAAPCVIFFDEIDSIAPPRGTGGESQVVERVVSQLLTEMDGIEELKGILVLAASNRIDMIDSALLRPGRFDLQIELPSPEEAARLEILKVHTRDKPLDDTIDLQELARISTGMVGAEIEALCREATLSALREFIRNAEFKDYKCFRISSHHYEMARIKMGLVGEG